MLNDEDNENDMGTDGDTSLEPSSITNKADIVPIFVDKLSHDEKSDRRQLVAVRHFTVYRLCPSDKCENL